MIVYAFFAFNSLHCPRDDLYGVMSDKANFGFINDGDWRDKRYRFVLKNKKLFC